MRKIRSAPFSRFITQLVSLLAAMFLERWDRERGTALIKGFYTKLFLFPERNRSQDEEHGHFSHSWLLRSSFTPD
jgi:hypothetical protein